MRRFLFSLCIVAFLSACSGEKKETAPPASPAATKPVPPPASPTFAGGTDEATVKNLVLRYNELLDFGYENMDMTWLQEVATLDVSRKAYHHAAALAEGGVRMTSALKEIQFPSVRFPNPLRAEVKTHEIWDYAYNDIKNGKKLEEEKGFVYRMTYILEKKEGRWMIIDAIAADDGKTPAAPAGKAKPASAGTK